jgi:hypothetical protein
MKGRGPTVNIPWTFMPTRISSPTMHGDLEFLLEQTVVIHGSQVARRRWRVDVGQTKKRTCEKCVKDALI